MLAEEAGHGTNPSGPMLRRDRVQFRLSMNIVPGGLQDTDLGAVPGSLPRTDAEVSVRPTVPFNLGSLFDW
jgi:hypothetical protein